MLDYKDLFINFTTEPNLYLNLVLYTNDSDDFKFYGPVENLNAQDALNYLKPLYHSLGEIYILDKFVFVCIGSKNDSLIRFNVWKAMEKVYCKYSKNEDVLHLDGEYSDDALYALVIKSYKYNFLKKPEESNKRIKIFSPKNAKTLMISNAQNFARFLGDTPSNLLTPTIMSEYIKDYYLEESIDLKIYDKNFLVDQKMNLILAVSQGSSEEPKLVHAKYYGRDSKEIDLALVGKGVTFDTGGISIKPPKDMYKLKQDMMGGAIIASLLKIISQQNLKINVSLTIPLVENMPGASAVKPGDIVKSLSGITVDVDNTDAEGRLILADAITFAQRDTPKYLMDVATLTGAVRIALGNVHGAYMTDNDEFSDLIFKSSSQANDLLWRLPLSEFYNKLLDCHAADVCNIDRCGAGGGASVAGEFIKRFVDKDVIWAHFDVSGIRNNHFLKEIFGNETTARPLTSLYKIVESLVIDK